MRFCVLLLAVIVVVKFAAADVDFNGLPGRYSLLRGGLVCCTAVVAVKSKGRKLEDVRFLNGVVQCKLRSSDLERSRLDESNKFRDSFGFRVRTVMPLECGTDFNVSMELYRPSETFEYKLAELTPIIQNADVKYLHFVRSDKTGWCVYREIESSSDIGEKPKRNSPSPSPTRSKSPDTESDGGKDTNKDDEPNEKPDKERNNEPEDKAEDQRDTEPDAKPDKERENKPDTEPDNGENDQRDTKPDDEKDPKPDAEPDGKPDTEKDTNPDPESNVSPPPPPSPTQSPTPPPPPPPPSPSPRQSPLPLPTATPSRSSTSSPNESISSTLSPLPAGGSVSIINTPEPNVATNSSGSGTSSAAAQSQGSIFVYLGPILGAVVVMIVTFIGVYCVSQSEGV